MASSGSGLWKPQALPGAGVPLDSVYRSRNCPTAPGIQTGGADDRRPDSLAAGFVLPSRCTLRCMPLTRRSPGARRWTGSHIDAAPGAHYFPALRGAPTTHPIHGRVKGDRPRIWPLFGSSRDSYLNFPCTAES